MTVAELIAELAKADPTSLVTATDPHLHVECHAQVEVTPWTILIGSTGRVVTEEDVS